VAVAAVWTLQPGAAPGTARGLETLAYRESAASGAKVEQVRDAAESQPVRILRVNGKPVASSILIDRRLQYMLGLITTLIHPDPRRTLCIGLGTGMSARALAAGSRELEVIELSPAVVAMQPYFSVWNGSIHERANTRIRIDDGRAFLEQRAQSYECISADPIDPCVAGSAYLYTLEYYRLGARHLTPDGVMSQWIPLYDLAQEDIASIVRTFLAVFPHAQGWVTGYDLVLVGSQRPLTLDPAHWERRLKEPEIAALAADVGILTVDDLLGSCFALREDLERLAARAPTINTDDRPWIEFHAPLANFGSYPSAVYRFLAECRTPLEFAAGTAEHRRAEIQTRRRQLMDAAWDFARDVETSRAWGEARNRYIERLRGR
jgi:spermidine synthase